MPVRFLRLNLISGIFVALIFLVVTYPSSAADNDWVDEGVNEFHLPRAQQESRPPTSPEEELQQQRSPSESRSRSGSSNESDERPGQFVPPDGGPIKNVTDEGGVELGSDGRPRGAQTPLEAGISTWQKTSGPETAGLDQKANRLLAQAPMLAKPKVISANPKAFRAWLNETHPGLSVTKEQIVEVKGEWDDAAHALRTFGLPYTQVSSKRFAELNLDKVKVIVINCEGHLPAEAMMSLRRFVAMGGFLLTTDWALQNVVQRTFPGFVAWNEGWYTSDAEARIVDAVVVAEDPDLFAGIPPIGHWQLVKKSQLVKVLKPDKVKVLVRSRLMTEDPSRLGILALTFEYGTGRVMHLVGHFDNNSELAFNTALPDRAPGINVSLRQAIAANFLAQALNQGDGSAKRN